MQKVDKDSVEAQVAELERENEYTLTHRISDDMDREWRIRYGNDWHKSEDMKRMYDEQRNLEDKAIRRRNREIAKLKEQL